MGVADRECRCLPVAFLPTKPIEALFLRTANVCAKAFSCAAGWKNVRLALAFVWMQSFMAAFVEIARCASLVSANSSSPKHQSNAKGNATDLLRVFLGLLLNCARRFLTVQLRMICHSKNKQEIF